MLETSESLRPYVPELVVQWLNDAPDQLRRDLVGSLVFADLSGFTALSERLARLGRQGAEELTEVIEGLFAGLISAAHSNGGQMLTFGGDALLLLFEGDQHAHRAVQTAHVIRSQVRATGEQTTGVGRVQLRVSIGVNSGSFHAILTGDRHRMLLLGGSAVSETVATENAARAGEIALATSTASILPAAHIRERDGVRLLRHPPRVRPVDAAPLVRPPVLEAALPPALRDHLVSSVDLLQHRSAAVAFARIEDLDRRLAEHPDAAAQALSEVVDSIQEGCSRYEVCLIASDIDRDGVKLILTSGVPTSSGDDEERMLLAARAILDADPALPVRIGVHRGSLFAGVVGSAQRRTYTVMGDTVNIAARVMASAPPGRLRATTVVLDHSRAAFTTTSVEPFTAKGKKALIHAVEVDQRDGDSRRPAQASTVEVFGRDRELQVLRDTWRDARAGRARFVELVGEPGIGKTTVVEAIIRETAPHVHLRLRGDLYTRTTPYRGLASLLETGCGLPQGSDRDVELLAIGARLRPELRERLPLLNDILATTIPPTAVTSALADAPRRRARAALATELLAMVLPHPTVLELEDTHWFDEATAEWLASVAADPPPAPWCVVSTRRPVDSGFALDPGSGPSLCVEPLGEEAAAALVRAERGDRSTPPELVRRLSQRASGNPLYLRELVRALGPEGSLDELPDSLEALLTTRLDRLPPTDRHVVCRASVLGLRFTRDLLTTVLDSSVAQPTPEALDRVADFLGPAPGGRLGFSHALIRDAAYQLLPFRLRRELHGRVAEHLTASVASDAGVLSFHYFAAQRWSDAWLSSRSAADAALASHAPVEAAELLSRALQAGRRMTDLSPSALMATGLELSRAYERSGQFDAAEHNYRSLSRLTVGPLDRARLKVQLAWLAERRSRLPLAVRRARRAVHLLETAELEGRDRDICRAEARTVEGMALEVMGQHRAAAAALSEAVELAQQHGADRTEAQAASILDWSLAMTGDLTTPVSLQRALDLYRAIDDVPGEAACLTNLGALAYLSGQWTEAVEYYRQGREAHARSGDETSAALGAANTAEVLSDQGHWEQAGLLLQEAIEVWRSTGHEHGVAYAMGLLGRTRCRAGQYAEGLAALGESRERHLTLGAKDDAAQVWLWTAEGQVLSGDPDRGQRTLVSGADDGSVTGRRVHATALALKDRAAGIEALRRERERATRENEQYETVVLDHTLAALEPQRAAHHLSSSQDVAARLGVQRVALPTGLT